MIDRPGIGNRSRGRPAIAAGENAARPCLHWRRASIALLCLAAAYLASPYLQSAFLSVLRSVAIIPAASGATGLSLSLYYAVGVFRTALWTAAALWVLRFCRIDAGMLHWRGASTPGQLGVGIVAGCAGAALGLLLMIWAHVASLSPPTMAAFPLVRMGTAWLAAEALIAFAEEALFRVTLYVLFKALFGRIPAGLLSAALFVAAHGTNAFHNPIFAAQIALAGIAFVIGLDRTSGIWLPTGLHAGWNWAWLPFLGLQIQGRAISAMSSPSRHMGP